MMSRFLDPSLSTTFQGGSDQQHGSADIASNENVSDHQRSRTRGSGSHQRFFRRGTNNSDGGKRQGSAPSLPIDEYIGRLNDLPSDELSVENLNVDAGPMRRRVTLFGRRRSNDSEEGSVRSGHSRQDLIDSDEELTILQAAQDDRVTPTMRGGNSSMYRRTSEALSITSVRSSVSSNASSSSGRKRGSVYRAMQRISFRQGAPQKETSVYLDGKLTGHISVKPSQTVAATRKTLQTEIPTITAPDFCFWYSQQRTRAVDIEDESTTRISACLDETNMLYIFSKNFMDHDESVSYLQLSDEEIRDLTPGAESVVRCCLRLAENDVFNEKTENSTSKLPKLSKLCMRFITAVVRASVDSKRTLEFPDGPKTNWSNVDQLLQQMEEQLVLSCTRQEMAQWWYYRTDQQGLVEIVTRIQNEFRFSPTLSPEHPVFYFKLPKASEQVESLLDVLHKVNLVDFAGKKYAADRERLADMLGVKEEALRSEILLKKEGVFTSISENARILQRHLTTRQSEDTAAEMLSKAELEAMLAPLLGIQDAFIRKDADRFCEGTREWAFRNFDRWIADCNSSNRGFVFTGPAGSGKSCFVSKLIRDRQDRILAYHFCRHDDHRFRDPKVMLLSIIFQLSRQSPHFDKRIRQILEKERLTRKKLLSDECSVKTIFSDFLAGPLSEIEVPPTDRFVIIIDGIDEAKHGIKGSNDILDMVQGLFNRLPNWIVFLVTTKPRLPVLKKLRKFNALLVAPKGDDNDRDFRFFFRQSLSLRDTNSIEDVAQILAANASDSFLFCRLMCSKINDSRTTDQARGEYMMMKFEQLLRWEYAEVCQVNMDLFLKVVKLSMVAIQPLDVDVIVDLVGSERGELLDFLEKAKCFLLISESRIRFVHKVSKDWLLNILCRPSGSHSHRERRLSYSGASSSKQIRQESSNEEVSICHQFFAEQVRRLMIEDNAPTEVNHKTRKYLLEYGVHHLAVGGMFEEAKELILSPAWLASHSTDIGSVVKSCGLLSEGDHLLALLARAVSLSYEATRTDPRQLTGQLVGRLIAVTAEGHGDDVVRERMIRYLDDLRSHDYGYEWWCPLGPTWDQAEQPYLRTLSGHSAPVQSVAWHWEGRQCASGSWDGDVRIFDTLTGHCSRVLSLHTSTVWTVDWETNGHRLASGSLDRSIVIWDTETGESIMVLNGHKDSVWSVSWSRDSKALASGSKDKTIRIWSMLDGVCTKILSGTNGLIYSVSWEGDASSRLCSGSTENMVRVWDTKTAACVAVLEGHRDWIRSVTWCKTGRNIVSASADQTLRVWSTNTFECEHVLMGHSDTVWSVSKCSDGRYAVSGSSDGTIRVWDCTTGRSEQVLDGHKGAVWSVAFAPCSKRVVSGSADHSVMVWDACVGLTLTSETPGHLLPIWCLDVSKDGSVIVSGSADKTARLWNINATACEKIFSGHTGSVFGVKLSTDGTSLATASSDCTAAVYRISTGDRKLHLVGHTAPVWCVTWSNDDSIVFTGSKDMTIRLWNSTTGRCKSVLDGHTKDIKGLSVSLDGKRLATASADSTIRIWNIKSRTCESTLSTKQESGCLCVQWNPQIKYQLVAGYASGSVCIWDADSGEQDIDFLPGHSRRTNSVAWSPDGERVVSSSSDKEIRIWNMDGNQCERKIQASNTGLFGIAWTGQYIISCGTDKSIRLFHPDNGRCEAVMAGENRTSLGILDMALSKDGKYAVSGSRQRIVQIWNAETGKCERTLSGHTNWVHTVVFDESGKLVLSRSDDDTSRLWDVATGACLMVYDDQDMTPPGFVAQPKTPTRSLSAWANEGQAVGVLCDRARVEANKACGWIGKQVYFFQLMGSKAPPKTLQSNSSSAYVAATRQHDIVTNSQKLSPTPNVKLMEAIRTKAQERMANIAVDVDEVNEETPLDRVKRDSFDSDNDDGNDDDDDNDENCRKPGRFPSRSLSPVPELRHCNTVGKAA